MSETKEHSGLEKHALDSPRWTKERVDYGQKPEKWYQRPIRAVRTFYETARGFYHILRGRDKGFRLFE